MDGDTPMDGAGAGSVRAGDVEEGWHLTYGGQAHGPHPERDVRAWYAAGQLPPDTLGWRPGAAGWQPLAVLLSAGTAPPPPPPAPPQAPSTPGFSAQAAPSALASHGEVGYGNLGRRLGGVVLDIVIFYVAVFAVYLVDMVVFAVLPGGAAEFTVVILNLTAMVGVVVWQLLAIGRLGQSYGKHLAGVKVVDATTGGPIGGGTALLRSVVQSLGLWVFGLGWLWALWDSREQTWHDKAAGSVVLDATASRRVDPLTHLRATFHGHW